MMGSVFITKTDEPIEMPRGGLRADSRNYSLRIWVMLLPSREGLTFSMCRPIAAYIWYHPALMRPFVKLFRPFVIHHTALSACRPIGLCRHSSSQSTKPTRLSLGLIGLLVWQAVFTFNPHLQISAINCRYL